MLMLLLLASLIDAIVNFISSYYFLVLKNFL